MDLFKWAVNAAKAICVVLAFTAVTLLLTVVVALLEL
jgi:hypothetical protein